MKVDFITPQRKPFLWDLYKKSRGYYCPRGFFIDQYNDCFIATE